MSYCFHPKPENFNLDDMFPMNLSWFSERVGAFDDEAEFKQLEKVLGVDMKIIDHMQYEWANDFCSIKTSLEEFEKMIANLKKAIKLKPNYFEKIKFQDQKYDDCKSYLSNGEFEKDIDDLQRIAELYKSKNIQEMEISYM